MGGPHHLPLPPSPMSDPVPKAFGLVALPWITALYLMFAGLLVGALCCIILNVSGSGLPVWIGMDTGVVLALGSALFGLGMAAADRLLPRWPRAFRWALGMGATGLVPVGSALSVHGALAARDAAAAFQSLVGAAIGTTISGVIMGMVLGWAARRREGLHRRMVLAGSALALLLVAPMAVGLIMQANSGQGSPNSWAAYANVGVAALLPILLALVLARMLTRAEQQEPAD